MTAVASNPGIHVPVEPPNPPAQQQDAAIAAGRVAQRRFATDESKESNKTLTDRQIQQIKKFGDVHKNVLALLAKYSGHKFVLHDGRSHSSHDLDVPFLNLDIISQIVVFLDQDELYRQGEYLMTDLTKKQREICISEASEQKCNKAKGVLEHYLKESTWTDGCCFTTFGCRNPCDNAFSADPRAWGGHRAIRRLY